MVGRGFIHHYPQSSANAKPPPPAIHSFRCAAAKHCASGEGSAATASINACGAGGAGELKEEHRSVTSQQKRSRRKAFSHRRRRQGGGRLRSPTPIDFIWVKSVRPPTDHRRRTKRRGGAGG
ncbi:hypothetical protein niasHT_003053 [Heterodera trifolii]|uniref:Uncharacterized protein n=1 Tax=Heterodera trifolii TaxID=157864 RepID=A0ABD2M618_9BILA